MADRSSKRRRLDGELQLPDTSFHSAHELHEALHSQQSVTPEVRASINRFKDFLSRIKTNEDHVAQTRDLKILREYCHEQTSASKDEVDFPDLLSTWSHAVQSSNDPISSAVPAALAQFFKTISGLLEFREFGLSLCHSLLKRDQLRLFDRALSAPKSKDYLISPCLRLLVEVISFDGGTLASNVFVRRDFLFKRLDNLLDSRSTQQNEDSDRRKPSLRRMALRVVIACLKFLDPTAKSEFITQHRIFRSTFRGLIHDGDDIVADVLATVDTGVIEDVDVQRGSKLSLLNQDNLAALLALYTYEADPNHQDSAVRVREIVHDLLKKICTARKGICILHTGWYPLAYELNMQTDTEDDFIDLGLDSPLYFDNYTTQVPVKNTILSSFIQVMRPESDVLQMELILSILKFAPELVADFFSRRKFASSPNDDAQWRGQFAFIFGVTQLPVPANFGWHEDAPPFPPPTSIVVESIVPRPMDRATLTRCFSLNDEVLLLSGCRFLSVSLEKMGRVLRAFETAAGKNQQAWQQSSRRLIEAVLERFPLYKEIIQAYQRSSKGSGALRTALFECIANIHKLLPEAIAGSKFDVGPILLDVLSLVNSHEGKDEDFDREDLVAQLSWLVQITVLSPATKWWTKSGNESLSLFTMLLRFTASHASLEARRESEVALGAVISLAGILTRSLPSFTALRRSLEPSKYVTPTNELYLFVDNSIHRAIQRPVRYLDQIEQAQHTVSDKKSVSLLACSVAEQWEFALKKFADKSDVIKTISRWIACFYGALEAAGENFRVLTQFREAMENAAGVKAKGYLQSSFEKIRKHPVEIAKETTDVQQVSQTEKSDGKASSRHANLDVVFGSPIPLPSSLEGLTRWDTKTNLEHAIQSNRVSRLIRCTASPEQEIRLQAFQHLQTLAHLIDFSSESDGATDTGTSAGKNDTTNANTNAYAEKAQVYLLIGELLETIRHHGLTTPLPTPATELASRLLTIVSDPSHAMFAKANKFLLRSPSWNPDKLIPHWLDKILFHEPDEPPSLYSVTTKESNNNNNDDDDDDRDTAGKRRAVRSPWNEEVDWLLRWLAESLRTPADMEIYRRSGAWEKILTLYIKPGLLRGTRKLILTIIWRGLSVGGYHHHHNHHNHHHASTNEFANGGGDTMDVDMDMDMDVGVNTIHDGGNDAAAAAAARSAAANTLITRVGLHKWLDVAAVLDNDHAEIIRALSVELWRRRDKEVIDRWQKGKTGRGAS